MEARRAYRVHLLPMQGITATSVPFGVIRRLVEEVTPLPAAEGQVTEHLQVGFESQPVRSIATITLGVLQDFEGRIG